MTSATLYYNDYKRTDRGLSLRAALYAVPKGRPRFSGKGHTYTPETTRAFETAVRALAVAKGWKPYSCPVAVTIVIEIAIPVSYNAQKRELAKLGLITPPRGDLDNRIKAITDALNGVAYYDDVQITRTIAEKVYAAENLICVEIHRAGLSDMEIDRFIKLQKASHANNTGRRPTVG